MSNLEALQEAAKSAMTARDQCEQRIAENKSNWDATSNTVKDVWTSLGLAPRKFKVGQIVFTCSIEGISNEPQFNDACDPKKLNELLSSIKGYLDEVRASFDEKMQP